MLLKEMEQVSKLEIRAGWHLLNLGIWRDDRCFVSVDIAEIKIIRVVKKSGAGKGALYGFLIAGGGSPLLITGTVSL